MTAQRAIGIIREMPGRRWMARVVMTLIATMASAAPASADTLSVSSRPAHPSGVTPVTFTAKWSTKSTTATVSVGVEPTNVNSCPTTPDPNGVRVIDAFPAIGTKSTTSPATTFKHGTYLVCGWLVDVTGVLATDHRRLKVSNPDRLSMTAPATATDGATSSVTFTGVADVPDPIVYVKRIPGARARCGRDPRAGSGQPLTGAAPVPGRNGSFRSVASIALGAGPTGVVDAAEPGAYTLCAWLLDVSPGAGDVLARAASASVTLKAPTGTLAYNVPELVKAGHRFRLVARYDTSAPNVRLYVDFKRLPASGPVCGAAHGSDRHAVKLITIRTPGTKTTQRVRLPGGGVYVTCAWLEWSHGAIDGPFAGRIVVARSHQRPTYWCGRTSQRLRGSQTHHASCTIGFETIDGQVVYLSYWARFTCTAPGRRTSHKVYTTSFPVFGMSSRSSFLGHYRHGSDRASVSAVLKRKRGRGAFRESYRSDAYTCRSGLVRFTVRRA